MDRNLYIVVGSPLSDIGKGWLAGSIASALSSALIIKVDPVLNPVDFAISDLTKGTCRMTDVKTYEQLGLSFETEQLFLQGNVLLDFLNRSKVPDVNTHTAPRLTYADVATYLSQEIATVFKKSDKSNLVIEVGGVITDAELVYIPTAFKQLSSQLSLKTNLILLSYLDYSEDSHLVEQIKTRHISYGIEQVRRIYGEPERVFFRRRNLSTSIEQNLDRLKESISKRASYPSEKLVYLPNFTMPIEERDFIKNLDFVAN